MGAKAKIDFQRINAALDPRTVIPLWLPGGRVSGANWVVRNPTRDDKTAGSFSVNLATGQWADFAGGDRDKGGDLVSLYAYLFHNADQAKAARELADNNGITDAAAANDAPAAALHMIATYDYLNCDGELLYQVCRFEPKTFRQRRPDSSQRGGWNWSVKDITQVPYLLPHMLANADAPVFVVEGEKDADNLAALGLVATCNAGGAKKWRDELTPHFRGRRVCIVPDNDEVGRDHATLVSRKLVGVAADVRIVTLPNLPEKGDVSDWLAAGGDAAELLALTADAPSASRALAHANDNASVDVHEMQQVEFMSWPHMSDKGQPLNTIPNLRHLLGNYGFVVRYDVIRKDLRVTYPGQCGTQDNQRSKAVDTVLSLAALNRLPKADVQSFLLSIGDDNAVNPVREFFLSRPWDHHSRFAELLETIKTRPGYDRDLLALLVRRWLVSAVAAAAKPFGFWSKGVLVFQGAQSLGKTSWFRSLLPETLRDLLKVDATINPADKDTIISAVSHWLVELGELDGTLRKTDIARLKGFISQDVDQFRRSYGRTEEKFQRRTVFFASVNPEQFLADDTGNARWWTVPVDGVNHAHGIDMQQLWAEVHEWFKQGERWWLNHDEEMRLEAGNASHQRADPIEDLILSRYDREAPAARRLTATEILIELGYDKPSKATLNEAASVMKKHFGDWSKSNGRKVFAVPPLLNQRLERPF